MIFPIRLSRMCSGPDSWWQNSVTVKSRCRKEAPQRALSPLARHARNSKRRDTNTRISTNAERVPTPPTLKPATRAPVATRYPPGGIFAPPPSQSYCAASTARCASERRNPRSPPSHPIRNVSSPPISSSSSPLSPRARLHPHRWTSGRPSAVPLALRAEVRRLFRQSEWRR